MSTPITLTFLPDEYKPLLDGRIKATMRTSPVLKRGDEFYAGATGLRCRVTSVRHLSVGQIVAMHYRSMGFSSHEDAFIAWRELHPHIGHLLNDKVYFYRFEQVPNQAAPTQDKAVAMMWHG